MTRADPFALARTLLVFIALGATVIGSRFAASDRMAQALQLNATARWLYALLFVVVASIALLY